MLCAREGPSNPRRRRFHLALHGRHIRTSDSSEPMKEILSDGTVLPMESESVRQGEGERLEDQGVSAAMMSPAGPVRTLR
ncbi:hypothetical protein MN0502_12870 [Arthrobacter sp. MN05-02]|nr:hypothetical protein MN0502_12870 [Arthrobacter sp. MN05-02]